MNIELTPKHPFYSANDFFREKLGSKVVKLALNAGFTCPNRDGSLSYDGCIFCSGEGSGDFAASGSKAITEQIEQMKKKMSVKWGYNNIYMAYFQAFTNTYAPIDMLKKIYEEAANSKDIKAISIGTRPDCINEEVCDLLYELSKKVFICVELGLQTSNDTTGDFINRCYKTEVYTEAVKMLKAKDINVVTHIILGLPGETPEDMRTSVDFAVKAGTDGIKLQLLHILKGTRLYEIYKDKPFKIMEKQEYINLIADIIESLPPTICVHRITGDGDKAKLAEPWWSLDKRSVLNGISKEFIRRNTYQGMSFKDS